MEIHRQSRSHLYWRDAHENRMRLIAQPYISSYFPSAFILFLLVLMSETKWGAHGWSNSSLIYVLCFGVFSFMGSFGHWDVSEALGANISLKLTLLFFLPSDSPRQRFGLRAACLETAAAFGRSIQDSEDNWSVSLCVAGSTNHPGLRRIATMTDMFVCFVLFCVFFFFALLSIACLLWNRLQDSQHPSVSYCLRPLQFFIIKTFSIMARVQPFPL